MKSPKMQNEISNIFHVNFHVKFTITLWGQSCLLCCPKGGSQSPTCGRVHPGEPLIFDVTGGIIFMYRVWAGR